MRTLLSSGRAKPRTVRPSHLDIQLQDIGFGDIQSVSEGSGRAFGRLQNAAAVSKEDRVFSLKMGSILENASLPSP